MTTRRRTSRLAATGLRADRGSVSVELAILAPALLLLVSFAIWAGRTRIADNALQEAARSAARQASLAVDQASAADQATAQARQSIAEQNVRCSSLDVTVDTAGFQVPVGTSADVTVTLTCTVAMSDLLAPGLPGAVTLHASFASPVDAYRER